MLIVIATLLPVLPKFINVCVADPLPLKKLGLPDAPPDAGNVSPTEPPDEPVTEPLNKADPDPLVLPSVGKKP